MTAISKHLIRATTRIIHAEKHVEGAGFVVRRPIPSRGMVQYDPFLLLDHMGPVKYGPGEAAGAPDHPHRGFETVSYILDGEMQHKDSRGNKGSLGPGDVQWMTAGAGIVHSEMPSAQFQKSGGLMHGFQIWVNLPRAHKMALPRYQEEKAATIPKSTSPDGLTNVTIIAGESYGVRGKVQTFTPIAFLHFRVAPGGIAEWAIPRGQAEGEKFNLIAYVVSGSGEFGVDKRKAVEGDMVEFVGGASATEGEEGWMQFENKAEAKEELSVLLLGGKPLEEPIERHGPFVMNTKQEIQEAFTDFYSGKMGSIDF